MNDMERELWRNDEEPGLALSWSWNVALCTSDNITKQYQYIIGIQPDTSLYYAASIIKFQSSLIPILLKQGH